MEGKALIFKEFAGVDAFPVCLATKDTDEIVAIVKAIAPVFGGINLEDISAPRCFDIETRLQRDLEIPVFHDDQHGTAVVVRADPQANRRRARKSSPAVRPPASSRGRTSRPCAATRSSSRWPTRSRKSCRRRRAPTSA